MASTRVRSRTCRALLLAALTACHPQVTSPGEPVAPPQPGPVPAPAEQVQAGSPGDPVSPPQVDPAPAADASATLVGLWWSGACADRSYPRELELSSDHSFVARDLVSPCPPAVTCVWSGIVTWSGSWSTTEQGVALTVVQAGQGPGTQTHPDHLGIAHEALVETRGDQQCSYARITHAEPRPAGR